MVVMRFALAHRHYASMRYLALDMFKLDGRVVDAEVVV